MAMIGIATINVTHSMINEFQAEAHFHAYHMERLRYNYNTLLKIKNLDLHNYETRIEKQLLFDFNAEQKQEIIDIKHKISGLHLEIDTLLNVLGHDISYYENHIPLQDELPIFELSENFISQYKGYEDSNGDSDIIEAILKKYDEIIYEKEKIKQEKIQQQIKDLKQKAEIKKMESLIRVISKIKDNFEEKQNSLLKTPQDKLEKENIDEIKNSIDKFTNIIIEGRNILSSLNFRIEFIESDTLSSDQSYLEKVKDFIFKYIQDSDLMTIDGKIGEYQKIVEKVVKKNSERMESIKSTIQDLSKMQETSLSYISSKYQLNQEDGGLLYDLIRTKIDHIIKKSEEFTNSLENEMWYLSEEIEYRGKTVLESAQDFLQSVQETEILKYEEEAKEIIQQKKQKLEKVRNIEIKRSLYIPINTRDMLFYTAYDMLESMTNQQDKNFIAKVNNEEEGAIWEKQKQILVVMKYLAENYLNPSCEKVLQDINNKKYQLSQLWQKAFFKSRGDINAMNIISNIQKDVSILEDKALELLDLLQQENKLLSFNTQSLNNAEEFISDYNAKDFIITAQIEQIEKDLNVKK